jgi:hypothetical protein
MHVFEEDQVGLDAFLYRADLMHYLAVVACVHQPLFGARRRQYPDPSVQKVAHDPPSQSMASRKFAVASEPPSSTARLFSIILRSDSARPPPPPVASVMRSLPLSPSPHPACNGKYVLGPPLHANHLASKAYSPECVEKVSLLKNSPYARFDAISGSKHTVFGAFWSFWSPISSHFRLRTDFFNSVTWPLPGHPEAMKMDPSPALFSHQAEVFSEVGLPLYGVLGSSHKTGVQRYSRNS